MALRTYILSILATISCIACAAQDKYALLVGISNYESAYPENGWHDINGVNDVNLLSPLLETQGFDVVSLTDEDATKKQIISELEKIESKATKGGIVYLHFSMHGQPFQDFDGDEEDGWDESIVPIDAPKTYIKGVYEGENHITDDELLLYTNKIRIKLGEQGCLYVAVDACHAGRSFRGTNTIRGTKSGFSPDGKLYNPVNEAETLYKIKDIPDGAAIVFMEACKNKQVNNEININNMLYGPMSYYIASTLQETAIGTDISWVFNVQKKINNAEFKKQHKTTQEMVVETCGGIEPQY